MKRGGDRWEKKSRVEGFLRRGGKKKSGREPVSGMKQDGANGYPSSRGQLAEEKRGEHKKILPSKSSKKWKRTKKKGMSNIKKNAGKA